MLTGIGQDYYGGGVALLKVSPLVRQRTIRPKDQSRRSPYPATGERAILFLYLTRILFPTLYAGIDSLYRPFPAIAVTHRLISALLILLIACSNYINLSFSRILQQIRIIHTQKLMGATQAEMNYQLFLDTFLTVGIAFLLSLLIAHDLIPVFNRIMSGRITTGFF